MLISILKQCKEELNIICKHQDLVSPIFGFFFIYFITATMLDILRCKHMCDFIVTNSKLLNSLWMERSTDPLLNYLVHTVSYMY